MKHFWVTVKTKPRGVGILAVLPEAFLEAGTLAMCASVEEAVVAVPMMLAVNDSYVVVRMQETLLEVFVVVVMLVVIVETFVALDELVLFAFVVQD